MAGGINRVALRLAIRRELARERRRAERHTQGTCGTAREAPTAVSSGTAPRATGGVPHEGGPAHPAPVPQPHRCTGLVCHIGMATGRGCDGGTPCPLEVLGERGVVGYPFRPPEREPAHPAPVPDIEQGDTATGGQGAGSSPLVTSRPGQADADAAANAPAGTPQPPPPPGGAAPPVPTRPRSAFRLPPIDLNTAPSLMEQRGKP